MRPQEHLAPSAKIYTDTEPGGFSSSAMKDALTLVDALDDLATSEKAHRETAHLVDTCRDVLRGVPIDSAALQHPVVAEAAQLYREATLVREAS